MGEELVSVVSPRFLSGLMRLYKCSARHESDVAEDEKCRACASATRER